jgi:hypothetical protein
MKDKQRKWEIKKIYGKMKKKSKKGKVKTCTVD